MSADALESAETAVRVCASSELADGGNGVRHAAKLGGEDVVVFFVRYDGRAYGYLNRCAHMPMELDWAEGPFLGSSGFTLCARHMGRFNT